MRRRRDPNTPGSSSQPGGGQGHNNQPTMIDGKMVHIRQISTIDEGVLYTHAISVSSLYDSILVVIYLWVHVTHLTSLLLTACH